MIRTSKSRHSTTGSSSNDRSFIMTSAIHNLHPKQGPSPERPKKKRYRFKMVSATATISKLFIFRLIVACTMAIFVIAIAVFWWKWYHRSKTFVLYDLDKFIPLKNASTTFTLDQFQFLLLHDRVVSTTDSSIVEEPQPNSLQQRMTLLFFSLWWLPSPAQQPKNKEKLKVKKQWQWKVPNNRHDKQLTNRIPTSLFHSSNAPPPTNHTQNDNMHPLKHICQIVCQFDRKSFEYKHFPHFLQQALPCYNIFHYFARTISGTDDVSHFALRNYMVLPSNITSATGFSNYIQDFIKAMEGSPYYVHMIYGFEESIPVHEDCDKDEEEDPPNHQNHPGRVTSSSSKNALLAIKSFSNTGWDSPNQYFLSLSDWAVAPIKTNDPLLPNRQPQPYNDNYELIQQIQQSVLGKNHYREGPSSLLFDPDQPSRRSSASSTKRSTPSLPYRVVQILILDRKYASRDFSHEDDIVQVLHRRTFIHNVSMNTVGNRMMRTRSKTTVGNDSADDNDTTTSATTTTIQFRLNVTYIPSFNTYTLLQQASFMHFADIIYSPHGAQLSNLIYIRPCTVCVEFFPRAYYLQFFQSLVMSARGLSYEGYPTATLNYTDKVADSYVTAHNGYLRYVARHSRINVASDFFIRTLPELMDATIQCRANYVKNNH